MILRRLSKMSNVHTVVTFNAKQAHEVLLSIESYDIKHCACLVR